MSDTTSTGKAGREDRKPHGDRSKSKGGILKSKGGQRPSRESPPVVGKVVDVSSIVHRAAGMQVVKRSRVSYPGATVSNVSYTVEFEGHPPISFSRMGEAIERSKDGPPEPVVVADVVPVEADAAEAEKTAEADETHHA